MHLRPNRRWIRPLLEAALIVGLVLGIRAWQQRGALSGTAPPVAGVGLDGKPVSLQALRGKPVLLQFWATWCGVCTAEQGSIQAVARDHQVLSVALGSGAPAELTRWMKERGVSYPTLADPDGLIGEQFGVRSLPTSFVLDGDGQVRFVEVGYTTEAGLRARLWWAAHVGG